MEKKLTRAEQRALEAYPVNMTPLNYQDLIEQFGGKTEIDVNTYPRRLFQQGYELAIKDVIALIDSNFLPAFGAKIIRLIEQEYE